MNYTSARILILAIALSSPLALSQDKHSGTRGVLDDIETKYTSVGKIGLTVTNLGTIGTRNSRWPGQPSCEYPIGSGIEHIYQGGLWVGALVKAKNPSDPRNNNYFVSTGANDRSTASRGSTENYEFNSVVGDTITELSNAVDNRPPNATFTPMAISSQDFICDYSDRFTRVPMTGDSILNHVPLGITVHQESYAWDEPFDDFFVILSYTVKNTSADTLDSVYVGFWNEGTVRNTKQVRPGTPGYFSYAMHGYDPVLRMAYSFDYNGLPYPPPADSYVGLKLLGAMPFPTGVDSGGNLTARTYFNAWQYRQGSGDESYMSPTSDWDPSHYLSRYSRMTQSMPQDKIDALRLGTVSQATYLLSTGPFKRLAPGDSVQVVFAVICAKKSGTEAASHDTRAQRYTLYLNANWAQKAYDGEDANEDNVLQPWEDIARRDSVSPTQVGLRYQPCGCSTITRYLLPIAPRRPKVRSEVENQNVIIYWDKVTAEESVNPITGKKDFEGYRIYRSMAGQDFQSPSDVLLNLALVGEFDKVDGIGYDAGTKLIQLASPKHFPNDTVEYYYRFPPSTVRVPVLNGWQYIYGISSFSTGDTALGIPSLESAKVLRRVVPGTMPTSVKSEKIIVYPNPYYVNAAWDGARERWRKIYFANLPARCEIRIYTLAGDVVTVLDHDSATYAGGGIEWFNQFGDPADPPRFSGGEHAWDLITRNDQAIATGLYLFTVEDKATGTVKRGKFMIIK